MTKEEALQLMGQGREKWNHWARSLLEKYVELVENGQWEVLSHIDFSGHDFGAAPIDLSDFIFPGQVDFSKSVFPAGVSFGKAVFHGEAIFCAAGFRGESSFVQAQFNRTPNFIGTRFAKPPHMLDMAVQRPGLFNRDYREALDDPEKFSVLGRLAGEAGEDGLAQQFHGNHIISRRHIADQWWQAGFWGGLVYQLFSNFGQSLMRPFIAWIVSVFVFAWLYASSYKPQGVVTKPIESGQLESFWNATRDWFIPGAETSVFKVSCAADEGGVFVKALYLSLKNGFLGLGGGSTEKITQVHACLYGINPNYSSGAMVPYIPDSVAFWGVLQMAFSAILIFLFCLALYKRFSRKY